MDLDTSESPPLLECRAGVATITLNRPAHRNRLHGGDLVVLLDHFRAVDRDPAVRVMVLAARVLPQRPVFCAGYHMGEHGQEQEGAGFEEVADALERLRPVTICALNGSVHGGATDFALACDFAIGVRGMEMRMPAAAIGLHYYPGGLLRYVSRLGVANARRAFLAAQTFTDQELLAMHYVSELAEPAAHADAVQALATRLLALAPLAQQALKRSLNEIARGDYDPERLRERQRATQASADFAEGCRAFAERRPAVFKGE
jgi:enoyl-CoA hydratase/carnithine racemase